MFILEINSGWSWSLFRDLYCLLQSSYDIGQFWSLVRYVLLSIGAMGSALDQLACCHYTQRYLYWINYSLYATKVSTYWSVSDST